LGGLVEMLATAYSEKFKNLYLKLVISTPSLLVDEFKVIFELFCPHTFP